MVYLHSLKLLDVDCDFLHIASIQVPFVPRANEFITLDEDRGTYLVWDVEYIFDTEITNVFVSKMLPIWDEGPRSSCVENFIESSMNDDEE